MRLRNGEHGYGVVTKLLHWLTVAAVAGQFAVGWTMDADDAALEREDGRVDQLEELGEERAESRGEAAEEAFESRIDRLRDELDAREDDYVTLRSPTCSRLTSSAAASPDPSYTCCWDCRSCSSACSVSCGGPARRCHPGPSTSVPESDGSSPGCRRSCSRCSSWCRAPGLLLVAGSTNWLAVHVTAQVVFLGAIALHVGLVLKHTLVRPHRHLGRML